jgi:predicted negative regulator of RcsB-dependent stress response
MPKAIKKRGKKKDAGAEADVEEKLASLKDTFQEKQKAILMYGGAALLIVIAIAGFLIYRATVNAQALKLEREGYQVFYNEYSQQQLPPTDRYQKALDLFQRAYKKKASPRVLLYIADSYYELGRYDDAVATLNDFTSKYAANRDLIPLAYKEMADIQLRKGNKEEALKALEKLYAAPGSIYKDYALIEEGRILESEGKQAEAVAKYRELTEKFKGSPFYQEAKAKLEEKK